MPRVSDVLAALESIAPARYAFPWDKIGLQVGDASAEVTRAVVALDRSVGAVTLAAKSKAELLLCHHPLIFEPLTSVTEGTLEGRTILLMAGNGISFIAAHTNWDAAPGGINDTLAGLLGIGDLRTFGSSAGSDMMKLVFFAPEAIVDAVVDACSAAGAGQVGDYTRCAFVHEGIGTFDAGPSTKPTKGNPGERSIIDEVRVEMACPAHIRPAVETALRKAHSYEEPAFDFIQLASKEIHPMGRVGSLAKAVSLEKFAAQVDKALDTKSLAWGKADATIQSVAVVGGAADGEWRAAKAAGADVLVTGEVKQHVAVEACAEGFPILAAGHYATEHPGCGALRDRLQSALPNIKWDLYTPEPGSDGRPR